VSETPDRLVAGFNDRHLDFRVVIDVAGSGTLRNVTATTLVLTHNWLGRTYLAIIRPFHRLILRAMMQQVATETVACMDAWPPPVLCSDARAVTGSFHDFIR
jgi:hypothetical protein